MASVAAEEKTICESPRLFSSKSKVFVESPMVCAFVLPYYAQVYVEFVLLWQQLKPFYNALRILAALGVIFIGIMVGGLISYQHSKLIESDHQREQWFNTMLAKTQAKFGDFGFMSATENGKSTADAHRSAEFEYPSLKVTFYAHQFNQLGFPSMVNTDRANDRSLATVASCTSSIGPQYQWTCYVENKGRDVKTDYTVKCLKDDHGIIHPTTCVFHYTTVLGSGMELDF
jgi:hypothetical protein